MTERQTTDEHTPATEITFAHASEPPTSDVTVYASLTREFLGVQATFDVIGNSHRVSVPALSFYELSSCATVENATGTEVTLTPDGERRRITHETDRLRCVTTVDRLPLAAFDHAADSAAHTVDSAAHDGDSADCAVDSADHAVDSADHGGDSFDLSHQFAPEAVTAVEIGDREFETYHTYPEHDLTVYSRSQFEWVAGEPDR